MSELLSSLNPMQRRAVLHGDGPLLILAGAGSGKTRTLTHRVAHLIQARGVEPWRILAVTFTNKAAAEMRQRLERLLGGGELPWVSTFHASCVRILRREIAALGFTSSFAIYDDQDQEKLIKECLRELSVADDVLGARAAAALIDAAKNRFESPESYDRTEAKYDALARVYRRYQEKLAQSNALDFTDLLLRAVELFEKHPDVLERYRQRFRHVLVDEYQDTNAVQYRLTNLLASAHRNLCVVGDEDQSIYRWRGAEIGNILDFERDYPDATVIRLEQNYRSTATILEAAGAVVAHNTRRKGKTLWTENGRGEPITVALLEDDLAEARYIAAEIARLERSGVRLRDVAVFYRTNAQSRSIEESLVRRNLRYVIIGGVRFFGRAEIKDVLAYLRVLVNPADSVSARRIVNVPPRGIGAATVERIAALAEEAGGFLAACRLALERGVLKPAARENVSAFLALIDSFRERRAHLGYPELTARIIEESGYGPMLREEGTEEAYDRLQNLEELLKGMKEHCASEPTLEAYLEQVALVSDIDGYDADLDRVTLMTLHSAKGLEFPVVFIAGMEEGLFPHLRAAEPDIEEERRLCYVGMTRAMKKLFLTHAVERRTYAESYRNHASRFLDEIPAALVQRIDLAPRPQSRHRDERSHGRYERDTDEHDGLVSRRSMATPQGHEVRYEEGVRIVYDDHGLRVGSRVRHASFGVGTVQGLEGHGENQKATIHFRSVGRKKLMVRRAALRPA